MITERISRKGCGGGLWPPKGKECVHTRAEVSANLWGNAEDQFKFLRVITVNVSLIASKIHSDGFTLSTHTSFHHHESISVMKSPYSTHKFLN